MQIGAQTNSAAAGIAELGYIAMAYISGSIMAASNILILFSWVMWRANSMQPIKKTKLDKAVTRQ
jgi:hypothetical protein